MHEGLEDALARTYRLERELGRGGMATVFLAHDIPSVLYNVACV